MTKTLCAVCKEEMKLSNGQIKFYCSKRCRGRRKPDVKPFTNTTLLALKYLMKLHPEQFIPNIEEDGNDNKLTKSPNKKNKKNLKVGKLNVKTKKTRKKKSD